MNELPAPTTRPRSGRWLGGVCAGLARRWDIAPGGVRVAFLLGTLLFGLGALVYVAAWLILPAESEDGVTAGQRGIVALAQLTGAALGLATLAVAGAAATLFGFGWAVVGLACIALVCVLAGWARLGPGWALLPIGALVLPSVALAVGGVQVEPTTSSRTIAPRTAADLRHYTSGLGPLTVDLRRTRLPATGRVPIEIEAGVRRTLIALPHDRCVRVHVRQHDVPRVLELGALLVGNRTLASATPVVFGDFGVVTDEGASGRSVEFAGRQGGRGPTLEIDYATMGGGLVVRDYPDDVDPRAQPDWPGYPVYPEDRPDTSGLSKRETKRMLREWRARREEQVSDRDRIAGLMGGPCAEKVTKK